ncbi:RDD family protein [Candidatus Methanocrinis natronophilus]|uniref:RDD family protein n=1 Tax=Candidatus Methanocrinis natronophilus TaxID=3033396 RepID=A0ABT5XAN2_9EURY|nr:RDD family protein [Candidatus Methanocrinis natronophilus]MDF0591770.1 RDD family protein [Candidatus Methanocrinis natronophilus]
MDETEAKNVEGGQDLATVSQRLSSFILDLIVLSVIYIALIFLSGDEMGESIVRSVFGEVFHHTQFIMAAFGIGYYTYFFGKGQTPGMRLVEIRLVRTDGVEPVGLPRGFLRWVGMEISGIFLLLGYIWILIDKKRQGWHDKIAGTYVVNV